MFQQLRTSVLMVLALTILTGLLFPLVITGLARLAFPSQAAGSLLHGCKSRLGRIGP